MMYPFFQKLRSRKGESLIESLIAILIFTCASLVMYAMVTTAGNINSEAREADQTYQEQMLIAERGEGTSTPGNVSVKLNSADGTAVEIASIDVDIYGDSANGLYAYYAQAEEGGSE